MPIPVPTSDALCGLEIVQQHELSQGSELLELLDTIQGIPTWLWHLLGLGTAAKPGPALAPVFGMGVFSRPGTLGGVWEGHICILYANEQHQVGQGGSALPEIGICRNSRGAKAPAARFC